MKVTMSKLEKSGFIYLKNVRVFYPQLFSIPEFDGEAGKPGFRAILDKEEDADVIKQLQNLSVQMCRDENKKQDPKTKKGKVLIADQHFIRDGDNSDTETLHGYNFLNLHSKRKKAGKDPETGHDIYDQDMPRVLGLDGKTIITSASTRPVIYSGCRVNTSFRPWFYQGGGKFKARTCIELVAVQFANDDEPIGRGTVTDEAAGEGFGEVEYAGTSDTDWDDEPDDENAESGAESDDPFA